MLCRALPPTPGPPLPFAPATERPRPSSPRDPASLVLRRFRDWRRGICQPPGLRALGGPHRVSWLPDPRGTLGVQGPSSSPQAFSVHPLVMRLSGSGRQGPVTGLQASPQTHRGTSSPRAGAPPGHPLCYGAKLPGPGVGPPQRRDHAHNCSRAHCPGTRRLALGNRHRHQLMFIQETASQASACQSDVAGNILEHDWLLLRHTDVTGAKHCMGQPHSKDRKGSPPSAVTTVHGQTAPLASHQSLRAASPTSWCPGHHLTSSRCTAPGATPSEEGECRVSCSEVTFTQPFCSACYGSSVSG